MSIAAIALLTLSVLFTLVGIVPCLGCLNYVGIPLSLVTAVVGVVGLASDRDPQTNEPRDRGLHLLAVVGGIVLMAIGMVRLSLGAGVL